MKETRSLSEMGYIVKTSVLNKTVSLVGEAKDTTVIDGAGVGHVVYVTSN